MGWLIRPHAEEFVREAVQEKVDQLDTQIKKNNELIVRQNALLEQILKAQKENDNQ